MQTDSMGIREDKQAFWQRKEVQQKVLDIATKLMLVYKIR